MTGAGLAFLRDLAAADSADNVTLTRLAEGLRKTFIVSRGPSRGSCQSCTSWGARRLSWCRNRMTWKEVVEAVASRPERRIAVQEYRRPNPEG